jgi:hypothetical protein
MTVHGHGQCPCERRNRNRKPQGGDGNALFCASVSAVRAAQESGCYDQNSAPPHPPYFFIAELGFSRSERSFVSKNLRMVLKKNKMQLELVFFVFCNLGFSFGISIWLFSFLSSSLLFFLPFFPFSFLFYQTQPNPAKPQFKMQNPTCGVLISNKSINHLPLPATLPGFFFCLCRPLGER